MLDLSDRQHCFYWQTDRNLNLQELDTFFLKRQQLTNDKLLAVLKHGINFVDSIIDISILNPDENVLKGSVNIVRKININNKQYIARMHPPGVKNGYFYVEKNALAAAHQAGVLVPHVLDIHEAAHKDDMDFMIMSLSPGVTMENAIRDNPLLEKPLVKETGRIMADIHTIKVEKFGSFDNTIAKIENKLVGLHNSYKDFILTGLEENLKRLVGYHLFDQQKADTFKKIFETYNFEPFDGPRLIQNDMADWNMLVDNDKVSAILDWDECHAGDPIADLACWSTFFTMDRYKTFLEGYTEKAALPDDYEFRFHFYRLRYTISKMALRLKRRQIDSSPFLQERIDNGLLSLEEETAWFKENM